MSGRLAKHLFVVGTYTLACGRIGYDPLVAPDYCAEVPALAAAPVIDGVLEPGLVVRPLSTAIWDGPGAGPPPGQTASFAVAWRPDGLYVYVEVVDPDRVPAAPGFEPWCGDAVELYVDSDGRYDSAPGYDDPGARQFVAVAPASDVGPVSDGRAYCTGCVEAVTAIISTRYVAAPRDGGYSFEMLVVASDLGLATWSLTAGSAVGLDLAVNVSDAAASANPCGGQDDGYRLGQYFLRVNELSPFYPWQTAEAFCTATLRD